MVTERGMTISPGAVIHGGAEIERKPAERKRLFWFGWIGGFAAVGLASGAVALTVSLLTACRVILESQGLSTVVSALLVGCLASFLLSAHGMDRLASMRMRSDR